MEDKNTMQKVLGTFDGYVDNATQFVGDAAGKAGSAAGEFGRTAGEALGTAGEIIGENVDSLVIFTKGLFGG